MCNLLLYFSEKKNSIQAYEVCRPHELSSYYSILESGLICTLCNVFAYTDEEQLFGELLSSDEEKVSEYKQWEDFASVATNLLEWLDELLEGQFDNAVDN